MNLAWNATRDHSKAKRPTDLVSDGWLFLLNSYAMEKENV